jgi:alcohol dehydrogenase class IV
LGISSPLIVTDPGVASLPMLDQILAELGQADLTVGVFQGVRGNPTGENVRDGVQAYAHGGHDGVVGLGGGSPLDVAKAVALMAGQTGDLFDYQDIGDNWTRVDPAGIAPHIAIPTTSGTGSEVGRASVITDTSDADPSKHGKKLIFHPGMLPPKVICDPALTLGLPKHLTAACGMDALSHNLEAYCATRYHPLADGVALEGMRLVAQSLRTAVSDGSDIAARSDMMAASTMGATAFQKGLGAMHAMAHPIGATLDGHHGLLNAILMPYVLAFNERAISERLGRAAAYMGIGSTFADYLDWVLSMRADLGIAHTLESVGVTRENIPGLALAASLDASAGGNPVKVGPEEFEQLLTGALLGRL